MAKVAIIMGSKSDFPVVKPAVAVLKKFGVETEVRVISAHRTPEEAHRFAKDAEKNGIEAIIGAAGKAAHLCGVIAVSYTHLDVYKRQGYDDRDGSGTCILRRYGNGKRCRQRNGIEDSGFA